MLTKAFSGQPARFDVLVAIGVAVFVVFAFAVGSTIEDSGRTVTGYSFVFGPAAALLLVFRRLQPVLTLLAIVLVIFVYVAVIGDDPGPSAFPIWVGLYTVAVSGDRRRSLIVAVLAAIVVSTFVGLAGPDDPTLVEQAAAVVFTLVPLLIGDAVRSRRALVAQAEERVRLAEEASEQEAQRRVQDERVRIARELHDVVAHSIATINVQSGVAAHVIDADPDAAREALVEIKQSSKSALGELRAMLGVLRDDDEEGDIPLAPSPDIDDIDALVEHFAGAASLSTEGRPAEMVDPAVGLVAYRVVQEGLTNTLKHAAEAIVDVELVYQPTSILVSVSDDGGVGPADDQDGAGLGLVGLTERVRAVGGTFTAEPRFGGGFDLRAELPYLPAVAS